MYISDDGGKIFSRKTTANGLGSNNTRDVFARGAYVYVATANGLSISSNSGAIFVNKTVANGLGSNDTNFVFVQNRAIYVGTDDGLSVSTNGGATFINYLYPYPVNGVHINGSILYVATGKGLYFIQLP